MMMKMMRIIVVRSIRFVLVVELFLAIVYFIDFEWFVNAQVAVLSSFLVIVASLFTNQRLVEKRLQNEEEGDQRDPLDKIDDPHELFEEEQEEVNVEELDFKEIVKEEKKKVKPFQIANVKQGVKGSFSFWRLGAYLFLVMGFIALKNNAVLNIAVYLVSLPIGIVLGYIVMKKD